MEIRSVPSEPPFLTNLPANGILGNPRLPPWDTLIRVRARACILVAGLKTHPFLESLFNFNRFNAAILGKGDSFKGSSFPLDASS